jgi:thiamine biosynthesis lipoprotein
MTAALATSTPVTLAWTDWSCTVSVVTLDRQDATVARAIVRSLMGQVDRAVSRFRDDSDLSRINAAAGTYTFVSPLALRLIDIAVRTSADTAGAVDPSLGADLVALGYDTDIDVVRARRVASAPTLRHRPGSWRGIKIDHSLRRVGVPEGIRLDLGATAKAWTVDEAVRRFHTYCVRSALVSIGGDLAVAGVPPRDGTWQIDVAEVEGAAAVRVGMSIGALATSSTMGRRWHRADGVAVHHLVDPRTGLPARGRWRTASVWAPTCLAANTASTWLLVDPDAAAADVAKKGYTARLVAHDGSAETIGDWPASPPEVSS